MKVSALGIRLIAALWGFCEATFFFVVPDVWISVVSVRAGLRAGLSACLWAMMGAVIGGMLLYLWGAVDAAVAEAILGALPGSGEAMILDVRAGLEEQGPLSMVIGGFTGVPYKVFAVQAGAMGMHALAFMAISLLARLVRFVLVAVIIAGVGRGLAGRIGPRLVVAGLLGLWALLYVGYFLFVLG